MLLQNNFEPIMLVAARTNWRFKIGISRGSSAVSRVQSYFRKFGNSARKAKANMELFIRSLFQFQVTHSNKFLHIHWTWLKNCWYQPTFMIFRSQSIWLTTNSGKLFFSQFTDDHTNLCEILSSRKSKFPVKEIVLIYVEGIL